MNENTNNIMLDVNELDKAISDGIAFLTSEEFMGGYAGLEDMISEVSSDPLYREQYQSTMEDVTGILKESLTPEELEVLNHVVQNPEVNMKVAMAGIKELPQQAEGYRHITDEAVNKISENKAVIEQGAAKVNEVLKSNEKYDTYLEKFQNVTKDIESTSETTQTGTMQSLSDLGVAPNIMAYSWVTAVIFGVLAFVLVRKVIAAILTFLIVVGVFFLLLQSGVTLPF